MNDSNHTLNAWFLRKDDGVVFGPATTDTLRHWAEDGRIAPTDEVSQDRAQWKSAPEISHLGMEWILEAPDAEPYGPVHVRALLDLGLDGTLPGSVRVRHARDGRRLTLRELGLAEGVALPGERAFESAAGNSPSGRPPSWSGMARERDQWEREAARWKARYESEISPLEASVRMLEEKTRAQADEVEALRAERDRYRIEREQFKRRGDPEHGGADDFQVAFSDLSQCYETLARQLADKTDQLSELRESLIHARKIHSAKFDHLQREVETAHREAHDARRHQAQSEAAYQQVLQSLRDLNFRFIRLRESHSRPEPASVGAPAGSAPGKSGESGARAEKPDDRSPRLRLTR